MRRTAALLLLLVTTSAYGYRREYKVMLDGARKAGSEVCFYDGTSGRNPFELFFSRTAVRCLAADDVLDFPPGLFHVFARHRDGYVSEYRDYFVYRGEPAPERGYRDLEIPLTPAAYLDMTAALKDLRPGESLGVWIAQTPTKAGTFLPLVDGETTMMVPADEPVVPLLIADHQPTAVGEPLSLPAGTHESLLPFRGGSAVVAWARLDREAADAASDPLTTPDVTMSVGGRQIKPLFPLYHTDSTNTLLFFVAPPNASGRIELHGRLWKRVQQDVTVPSRGAGVVREPLLLTPAAAVVVRWSGDPPQPARECHDAPAGLREPMRAAVEHCATAEQCQRVAVSAAQPATQQIEFEGLAPGKYRIVLKPPGSAKPIAQSADLVAGRDTTVDVPLEHFGFFGTVTLNDEPLPAHIFFDTGEAATDDSGRYTASLPANPRTALVRVMSCSDGRVHTFIPHDPIEPNTDFDIALHVTAIDVIVRSDGGAPIADADVWYAAVKDAAAHADVYGSPHQRTDAAGRSVFDAVPADQAIRLCAARQGFAQTCATADGRAAALVLHALALQGRIANHEGNGFLAAVDPQGHMTELVRVEGDGSFGFERAHGAPEYLVYTGNRRPLAVLPLAIDAATHQLLLTIPDAPSRSFSVAFGATPAYGFVGVWIGNAYIPLQMLAFHEEARGHDIVVRNGDPLQFHDVLETAPISVTYAPASKEAVDVFTLPQYAGVKRERVTNERVILTPQAAASN